MYCDQHVIKILLEIVQMLYTAWHVSGIPEDWNPPLSKKGSKGYKVAHPNHPMTMWVRSSFSTYTFATKLGMALAKEYNYRFKKCHACTKHILWLSKNAPSSFSGTRSPTAYYGRLGIPQCMPKEHHNIDPVFAYHSYYKTKTFGKWTKRNKPSLHNMLKSDGLSIRHYTMAEEGVHMTDDSKRSEKILNIAMEQVLEYVKQKIGDRGIVNHYQTMSLYDCQVYFHKNGGPVPDETNKNVYMKPDGGIITVTIGETSHVVLIVEDKVQGTNDIRFTKGLPRQATGNAIERGGKNIRGSEMLFSGSDISPYVMMVSGCDFHPSETIAKRIEMMNMGVPNHCIVVSSDENENDKQLNDIIEKINIKKLCGKTIVSVFIKTHKWNEMPHFTSMWKSEEIVRICCKVVDKSLESIFRN